MGLYEYTILSEEEQWNTLWDSGQFVTQRKERKSKYILYAIDKFFVEVELGNADKIVGKKVFKQGARLEKYIPNFDFYNL